MNTITSSPKRKSVFIRITRVFLCMSPLIFTVLMLVYKCNNPVMYGYIIREHGSIELLTALVYLLSCGLAVWISASFWRKSQKLEAFLYSGLALGLGFIFLEELNWGDYILKFNFADSLKSKNLRGENNFHKMVESSMIHAAYILVGFYGVFSRMLAPPKLKAYLGDKIKIYTPGNISRMFFLPTMVLYLYFDYLSHYMVKYLGPEFGWENGIWFQCYISAKDQEGIELILGVGFLIFVASNAIDQWRGKFTPAKA